MLTGFLKQPLLFDPAVFFQFDLSWVPESGFPIVSLKPFMAEAGQGQPDAEAEDFQIPTKKKNPPPGESPLPKSPAAPMKKPSSKAETPKKSAKAKATPKKATKKKPVQKETKQKAKAKMKRPAASQPSEVPDPDVPMKKPASAGASSSWKDGLASASSPPRDLGADLGGEEPEEEAVLECDPEIDVAATGNQGQAQMRDRVKMQKFMQMLSANQLPKFLQKAWEESQTMKVGKRERQTLIVNSLFERSQQGRLVMDLEKPIFKAMESSYVETSSKAISKSLPKLLFMGKFSLTEQMLSQGVESGQFQVVQTDDGEQYSWRQNSQTVKRGEKSEMGWEAKREGVSKDMAKYKAAAQSWSMGLMKALPSGSSSSTPGNGPGQLALTGGQDLELTSDHWEVVKKQIGQASGALDRMEKEALRHLNSLTDPDDDLYDVLSLGYFKKKTCGLRLTNRYSCLHVYIKKYIPLLISWNRC